MRAKLFHVMPLVVLLLALSDTTVVEAHSSGEPRSTVTYFDVSGPAWWYGDTIPGCCSSLFEQKWLRDSAHRVMCKERDATIYGPSSWDGSGYCTSALNSSGGYKYKCSGVVEGRCSKITLD